MRQRRHERRLEYAASPRLLQQALLLAKLQPDRIRSTMAFAGLYQLTHELIKTTVIENLRNFYTQGFDQSGLILDQPRYTREVLSKAPKKPFRASLLWLVEGEAITLDQADRLDDIYAHRHDLTHELMKYIVDPAFEPDVDLFVDALGILKAIERFWTQIEIDIGSFEHLGEVSVDDATPATLIAPTALHRRIRGRANARRAEQLTVSGIDDCPGTSGPAAVS